MKTWITNNWLKVVAIATLAGAIWGGNYPFVYYQLMNWIVVGAAIVTALQASRKNQIAVMWLFLLVAVVFNPIAPLYLNQNVWRIVDMVGGGLLIIALFV